LTDLEWVVATLDLYQDRICVSLDVGDEILIARGSGIVVGNHVKYLEELSKFGCKRFVVTKNQKRWKNDWPKLQFVG
jgi:phosphoribosylformimino-5-aminoimidazole carboxamide ribonucleotide (ProFAR) isomerase